MKNLLITFTLVIIIFSACKVPTYTINHPPAHPYVTLKNGTTLEGQHVKEDVHAFKQNQIVIDDKKYGVKEVAFYYDGAHTYANVAKKAFTMQVADGKLNLYRSDITGTVVTSNGMGGMGGGMGGPTVHSTHSVHFWVQAANSTELKPLSYKSLQELIPRNSSVSPYLQHCATIHRVSKIGQFGGLALMISGIVLAGYSGNNSAVNTGGYMFLSGAGICITSSIVKTVNKMKLHKIFSLYNKEG